MRSYMRAFASLFLVLAIIFAGFTSPALSTAQASTRAVAVLHWAEKEKGKPYKYGATGPNAFDCSGCVQFAYKKAGKKIGRTSGAQLAGKHISKSHKEKGDVIIFMDGGYACHSAIYAGDGKVWHAPKTGRKVSEEKIWTSSYVLRRPRSPSVAIAARSSPWKSAPRCRL